MAGIMQIDLSIRPGTGPMQFGGDWPGLYIRGDEAIGLAAEIDAAQIADISPCNGSGSILLQRVIDLLNSCSMRSVA